jgi:hypothetical protein
LNAVRFWDRHPRRRQRWSRPTLVAG